MAHRNNFSGQIREKGTHIAVDLQELREIVKDAVQEKFLALRDGAVSLTKETGLKVDGYVRRSPWAAMAIAAGAGTLLALLLRRRSD